MAKVLGMHIFALKPGAKAEEFEKFVTKEVYPLPWPEGMKGYLVKGDRGDREGRYLWVIELESVELRDRYFPSPGEMSEEFQGLFAPLAEEWQKMGEKWATFATPTEAVYTDYVVVGK